MRARSERGGAVVELAISVSVLLALCMGAADFGRVFYHALVLTDAAAAGATFGGLRLAHTVRHAATEAVVDAASADVSADSVPASTSDQYCDCAASPADGPTHANAVSCATGSCNGYGQPRVFVRSRATQTFHTVAQYLYVPSTVNVGQRAYRRVQ
jgi:Flp pilus assembly protein TadG